MPHIQRAPGIKMNTNHSRGGYAKTSAAVMIRNKFNKIG